MGKVRSRPSAVTLNLVASEEHCLRVNRRYVAGRSAVRALRWRLLNRNRQFPVPFRPWYRT